MYCNCTNFTALVKLYCNECSLNSSSCSQSKLRVKEINGSGSGEVLCSHGFDWKWNDVFHSDNLHYQIVKWQMMKYVVHSMCNLLAEIGLKVNEENTMLVLLQTEYKEKYLPWYHLCHIGVIQLFLAIV